MEVTRVAAVIGGLLLLTSPLRAQSGDPKIACAKASTTIEINFCAEQDFKAADARLNAAYKAMLGRVETGTDFDAKTKAGLRAAIQDAQRKWLAFRDADCKEAVGREWTGGTGMSYAVYSCLTEKTAARTRELEARPH
jgi:uncharacterized protein YecT (DUF1311 family)